jgi:hypothetical protein
MPKPSHENAPGWFRRALAKPKPYSPHWFLIHVLAWALAIIFSVPLTFYATVGWAKVKVITQIRTPAPKVIETPWAPREYHADNFNKWTLHHAVNFDTENWTLSLQRGALHGYILSDVTIPEHSEVTIQFQPHSEAIDFFIRLKDAFEVIIGDGDNRSIAVKKFSPTNPLWDDVRPPNFTLDRLPKYFLNSSIHINEDVTVKLIIDAPEAANNHRTVRVQLKFFDDSGKVVSTSINNEELVWTFDVEGSLNGDKRYGLGLVTQKPLSKQPSVTIKSFSVIERKQ